MAISPKPPAPTVPAIAEYPNSVTNVMAAPRTSEGSVSFKYTFHTICQVEAPKL